MPDSPEYENNPETSGWTRRFIACEPRLSEAIELYRESGFDVLLVDLLSEKAGIGCIKRKDKYECRECFTDVEEKYRIIYTKPKNHT
jgi:hypothetical protein